MSKILEPNFKSVTISKNQNTKDIVKGISKAIIDSREASKILAQEFKSKDPIKSCEKVFNYLKNNLQYIREGADKQTSKTLPRLIYDKNGDCKHYTIFSYAILEALQIPVFMRLVSQKILNKEPTHIYTYALINGKEYVIDPVMNNFNEECRHNYKCDLTLKKPMMTHLSGLQENSTLGRKKRGGFFSNAKSKLTDEQKRRKNIFQDTKKKHDAFLKKQGKKIEKGVKRFASIKKDVAVKAFYKAVGVNYLNLANRIKAVYKTHPEDLKKFWANYGSWTDLTTAVNKGTKIGAKMSGDEGGGGMDAQQYEEATKASVGIIQQIIEFFKKRKEKKNKEQEMQDKQAVDNMTASINNDVDIPKVDENGNPADDETADGGTNYTPFLIGGAGLAVLYFVTNQ